VLGAGCWVLGAGCWVLGAGCWVLGAGCWVLGAGCSVLGAEIATLRGFAGAQKLQQARGVFVIDARFFNDQNGRTLDTRLRASGHTKGQFEWAA
jgi:hypothetical protein